MMPLEIKSALSQSLNVITIGNFSKHSTRKRHLLMLSTKSKKCSNAVPLSVALPHTYALTAVLLKILLLLAKANYAQAAAKNTNADTPLGEHAMELYTKMVDKRPEMDFSGIIKMIKRELD